MDEDPISFETEYYAKEKGDVNSDVMVCMRMYYNSDVMVCMRIYCTQKVASFPGHSQIFSHSCFFPQQQDRSECCGNEAMQKKCIIITT